MFKPEYRISDYFLARIEKIAVLQAEIKKSHVRLPTILQLQKEVFNQNVHSSTAIEGNQLSLKQVAELNDNKEVKADDLQKLEVVNYIKALRWVTNHKDKKISEQDFLNLHRLITQGLIDEKKSGNYRKVQNYVIDGNGIVVYQTPASREVPKLML